MQWQRLNALHSHHPPVTAYCIWNDEHGVRLQGYNGQKVSISKTFTINIKQVGRALLHNVLGMQLLQRLGSRAWLHLVLAAVGSNAVDEEIAEKFEIDLPSENAHAPNSFAQRLDDARELSVEPSQCQVQCG